MNKFGILLRNGTLALNGDATNEKHNIKEELFQEAEQ